MHTHIFSKTIRTYNTKHRKQVLIWVRCYMGECPAKTLQVRLASSTQQSSAVCLFHYVKISNPLAL